MYWLFTTQGSIDLCDVLVRDSGTTDVNTPRTKQMCGTKDAAANGRRYALYGIHVCFRGLSGLVGERGDLRGGGTLNRHAQKAGALLNGSTLGGLLHLPADSPVLIQSGFAMLAIAKISAARNRQPEMMVSLSMSPA